MLKIFKILIPFTDAPTLSGKGDQPSVRGLIFMDTSTRICSVCKQEKEISFFTKNAKWCIECTKEKFRFFQANKPDFQINKPLLDGEIWMPVINYEGAFEVSNLGRLRCLVNTRTYHLKGIYQTLETPRILILATSATGYLKHKFPAYNNIKKRVAIPMHRLVALAFIPNINNHREVNHIDGDKTNNKVENLEWCDRSTNVKHAIRLGLKKQPKGFECYQCKMTPELILEIFNSKLSYRLTAMKFNIGKTTVVEIKSGKRYSEITNKHYIPLKLR